MLGYSSEHSVASQREEVYVDSDVRRGGGKKSIKPIEPVSGFTFCVFIYFNIDFFLHLSARIPGYGLVRPTLVLVLLLTLLLLSQKDKLALRTKLAIDNSLKVLLIFLVISLPFVTYPGSVVKNNIPNFVKAIVFFFFVASIVDTPKRLRIFLVVFVSCQVFRVLEPLYMNLAYGYWGSSTYMGGSEFASRLSGAPSDVINPNELGFVIVTVIPFLHFLLLPRGGLSKCIYFFVLPCLLYALILTMSRGAFLALVVVALFVFKETKYKSLLVLVGIAILVTAWSVMSPIQKDRYLSLVSSDAEASGGVEGRLNGIKKEFFLGLERPIFGHGLGTTPEAKFHKTGKTQASHSLYAELVIEIGLIGLILFLRFLNTIYREIKRLRRVNVACFPDYARLVKVLHCVFWMYLVYSINYWGLSQSYWYLLAGLVAVVVRLNTLDPGKDTYAEAR